MNSSIKSFGTILASIAVVLSVIFMPQCTPKPEPCNLPAPQMVQIDSFQSNGRAYLSWTQVTGNKGYRIRVIELDSPSSLSALRDTSVAMNETNVVISNLPINALFEFRVYAKCANDSNSINGGSTMRFKGVIVDECPMFTQPLRKKPCDTLTRNPSFQVEKSKEPISSFTINKFIQKPKRHYHIKIMNGETVVTDFLLISRAASGEYEICSDCGKNPPQKMNFNEKTRTFEWREPTGMGKIRLTIDDKTNGLILQTDSKRGYTVESSKNFGQRL